MLETSYVVCKRNFQREKTERRQACCIGNEVSLEYMQIDYVGQADKLRFEAWSELVRKDNRYTSLEDFKEIFTCIT